jgi:hypothetical protein
MALLALRHKADYGVIHVSQREAQQTARSAQALVQAVTTYVRGRVKDLHERQAVER